MELKRKSAKIYARCGQILRKQGTSGNHQVQTSQTFQIILLLFRSNPTENIEGLTWTPSTTNAPCYLQIGEDCKLMDGKPDEKEIAILRGLLQGAEKHKF